MAKIKIGDREIEMIDPEDLDIDEGCEAEKWTGKSMTEGTFAMMKIVVFASLRRAEPDTPPAIHASEAGRAKVGGLGKGDPSPPAEAADAANQNGQDPADHPTTGIPDLAPTSTSAPATSDS